MLKTFLEIFKKPFYSFLALLIFGIILLVSLTITNFDLIGDVWKSFGFVATISTIFNLFGSISTNFTVFSATYTILLALLFGINVSLFVFYIRRFKEMTERTGISTSTGGLLIGALGIGCASCGSLVVAPLFAVMGLGGLLTALPFVGEEFAIVGLLLLGYSTYVILKKIHGPVVCAV